MNVLTKVRGKSSHERRGSFLRPETGQVYVRKRGALAKHLVLPKPTVTFLIKKLEQAQYVKRSSVVGDLRRFEIQLTPLGRKACERGRKILSDAFEASLKPLSAKEKELYSSLLQKCAKPAEEKK